MFFPFGVTVTAIKLGDKDREGDTVEGPPRTINGCAFAPASSFEGSSGVVTQDTLFAPYGSGITSADKILLPDDPKPWYVDGTPAKWLNPFTGWQAGDSIPLTRTTHV